MNWLRLGSINFTRGKMKNSGWVKLQNEKGQQSVILKNWAESVSTSVKNLLWSIIGSAAGLLRPSWLLPVALSSPTPPTLLTPGW